MAETSSNPFKGIIYKRRGGGQFYTKKFLIKAIQYIHYAMLHENRYQICDCHYEHIVDDDFLDDELELVITNITIMNEPIIQVTPNEYGLLCLLLLCTDCGITKTIALPNFIHILSEIDRLDSQCVGISHVDMSNVTLMPKNTKPTIKQEKVAEIINFKKD